MTVLSLTEVPQSGLSNIPVKNGQLIFCRDTGNFYKDDTNSRIQMSTEFIVCSELPLAPVSNKLYLLLPNTLCFFNGEWVELNESPVISKRTIYSFPTIGSETNIYIATDENKTYRWNDADMKYYCIGSDYNDIQIINCGGA